MATTTKPHETDLEAGATITRDGYQWSVAYEPITFGFRQTAPDGSFNYYAGENVVSTFSKFSAAEETAAKTAFALWESVANIQLTDAGETNNATIELGNYKSTSDGAEAFTFFPGDPSSRSIDGDSFFNADYLSLTNDAPGTYSFLTFIHEFGHALGLEHPGDYDAGGGPVTYAKDATYYEDSAQYTVMSYFSETNTGANFKGISPQTPMIDDIEALQRLYGANMTTRLGDTTYGFHASADTYANPDPTVSSTLQHIYDFSLNKTPVFCIYDAGGNNTLDCSGYAGAQTINLNNGSFSSVMGLVDNINISDATDSHGDFITHVQNAIGGKGNDTIISGAAGDHMTGGAGANTFEGLAAALNDDVITDFTLSDKLDITDLNYGSGVVASFAAGLLTLSDDATSLSLTIDTTLTTPFGFTFRSDGHGGTLAAFTTAAPAIAVGFDTGRSATDGITRDNVLTLTGTVTANADVTLFDGDDEIATATANSKGVYSISTSTLTDGAHTLYVIAADAAQDTTTISAGHQVVVDTLVPTTPTAVLSAGSDTGVSSSDDITKVTRPTVTGTADAGTTVMLYDGLKKLGSVTAGSDNTYSIVSPTLAIGTHNLTVTSTDVAGNTSVSSSLGVTIDTKAAPVSIANRSATVTGLVQTISGKGEAGSTVTLIDNGAALGDPVTVGSDGTWSTAVTLATYGRNVLSASETDTAGNQAKSANVVLTASNASHMQAVSEVAAAIFGGFFGTAGTDAGIASVFAPGPSSMMSANAQHLGTHHGEHG